MFLYLLRTVRFCFGNMPAHTGHSTPHHRVLVLRVYLYPTQQKMEHVQFARAVNEGREGGRERGRDQWAEHHLFEYCLPPTPTNHWRFPTPSPTRCLPLPPPLRAFPLPRKSPQRSSSGPSQLGLSSVFRETKRLSGRENDNRERSPSALSGR